MSGASSSSSSNAHGHSHLHRRSSVRAPRLSETAGADTAEVPPTVRPQLTFASQTKPALMRDPSCPTPHFAVHQARLQLSNDDVRELRAYVMVLFRQLLAASKEVRPKGSHALMYAPLTHFGRARSRPPGPDDPGGGPADRPVRIVDHRRRQPAGRLPAAARVAPARAAGRRHRGVLPRRCDVHPRATIQPLALYPPLSPLFKLQMASRSLAASCRPSTSSSASTTSSSYASLLSSIVHARPDPLLGSRTRLNSSQPSRASSGRTGASCSTTWPAAATPRSRRRSASRS